MFRRHKEFTHVYCSCIFPTIWPKCSYVEATGILTVGKTTASDSLTLLREIAPDVQLEREYNTLINDRQLGDNCDVTNTVLNLDD